MSSLKRFKRINIERLLSLQKSKNALLGEFVLNAVDMGDVEIEDVVGGNVEVSIFLDFEEGVSVNNEITGNYVTNLAYIDSCAN